MAKQNFPKDGLRGPYSGQPLHLAAATGAGILPGCCGGMLVDRKRRSRGRTGRNESGMMGPECAGSRGSP